MKKKKFIPALPYALLSLQFNKGETGIDFTFTVNDGDLTDNSFSSFDYGRHGRIFAATDRLSYREKKDFSKFCVGFLENLKELGQY